MGEVVASGRAVPHSSAHTPGGPTGEPHRLRNLGFQLAKESFKNSGCQYLWGLAEAGETANLTGDFVGGEKWVPKSTQAHPPGNEHQKVIFSLFVHSGGSD